jgi:hypothetical protein
MKIINFSAATVSFLLRLRKYLQLEQRVWDLRINQPTVSFMAYLNELHCANSFGAEHRTPKTSHVTVVSVLTSLASGYNLPPTPMPFPL